MELNDFEKVIIEHVFDDGVDYDTGIMIKCENVTDIEGTEDGFNDEITFDGTNIKCEMGCLEYGMTSEAEDTKILFNAEECTDSYVASTQNILTSSHVTNQDDSGIALRSDKNLRMELDGHTRICFACVNCKETFSSSNNLNIHLQNKHFNCKPFKCLNCEKIFGSKLTLRHHQIRKHLKAILYLCIDCKKTFKSRNHLKRHQIKMHQNLKPQKHNTSFNTKSKKETQQLSKHIQINTYKNLECTKNITEKTKLTTHQETRHVRLKLLPNCHHLKHHQIRIDKNLKPQKCDTKSELESQQLSQYINPYKCLECSKNFTGKAQLTTHQAIQHLGLKMYECPICNKTFTAKHIVKDHQTSEHLDVKPYKCLDCGKSI